MSSQKRKFLDLSNIKGDIFGGLTAGVVALPLALAFGVQSGLGAEFGLYGAIFIGFFASLFGGTPSQISGPTAPMTALSMIVIAGIIQTNDGQVTEALPSIFIVFFLVGLFQIIFGISKVGEYIRFMPYPVVSGFMTGIGIIILITQLLPLFGYNPTQDLQNIEHFKPLAKEVLLDKILKDEANEGLHVLQDFKETVRRAEDITQEQVELQAKILVSDDASGVIGALRYQLKALKNINWIEFLLASLTILIIYGFKWITKVVPSTLVALIAVTLLAIFVNLEVKSIGTIPSGFPKLQLQMFSNFNFAEIAPYLLTSLTLALLGAIDSLLTSVVADNMTKTKHNSNQELIGQGIGNSIASIFGGIPGAGATIRTVVNIDAGGRTKLSGLIAALLLLVTMLVLGPYASQIPQAVLAGILITVGFGVMDYKGLRALPSMPKVDAFVLILVLLLTVFWDLIYAVGIGLIISSLMFMKKMSEITKASSTVSPYNDSGHSSDSPIQKAFQEEVTLKDINGPLFFGNTESFKKLAEEIPFTSTVIVLKLENTTYIDQSGLNALEDVLIGLIKDDQKVLIVGLRKQPRYMLESFNIVPLLVPEEYIFEDFESCNNWIKENVNNNF